MKPDTGVPTIDFLDAAHRQEARRALSRWDYEGGLLAAPREGSRLVRAPGIARDAGVDGFFKADAIEVAAGTGDGDQDGRERAPESTITR